MDERAPTRAPDKIPDSFLWSLPPQTRGSLLALGVRRHFESGRVLLREGDASSAHVEILVHGYAKVTAMAQGMQALLAIRGPGDILGEMTMLTGRPRNTTVTASGRVTSVVIGRANFRRFLQRHPDAALTMAAAMCHKLLWANRRRTEFAVYPAYVRLARLLADLATTCGETTGEGLTIAVMLSQPELASMVGIAEATVQKAMRDLRRHGLIRTGYRRITIIDVEALRALSDEG